MTHGGVGAATRPTPGPVRMVDVARLASVSQQTVSRVVNGHSNVGDDVRRRVQIAIAQLNYRPNSTARSLATSRSMNIGVISFGLAQFGPSVALFGIAEEARRHGYATNLVTLGEVDRPAIRSAFDHLASTAVDGIVVLAPVRAVRAALEGLDPVVPLVVFDPGEPPGLNSVVTDETKGARIATRHLLELGHETVWHVRGPLGWGGSEARVRGWSRELQADRRVVPEAVVGDWSSASGHSAGMHLASIGGVTAVFAANDQMALGVLKGLHDRGLDVPSDVSVVGFDDIPESEQFRPGLTTVHVGFDEVGRLCVDRILDLMKGAPVDTAVPPVEPRLVIRASTSPPVRPRRTRTSTKGTKQ